MRKRSQRSQPTSARISFLFVGAWLNASRLVYIDSHLVDTKCDLDVFASRRLVVVARDRVYDVATELPRAA